MPLSPLVAISYASAGGSYAAMTHGQHGQPVSAVMKIAWQGVANVLDHKILLFDEVHHLIQPSLYAKQLEGLRHNLLTAHHTVAVGFTGTLALDNPQEGRNLLDLLKGGADSDEGFLSSLASRPRLLFAEAFPQGVPDGVLSHQLQEKLVHRIPLTGESLVSYDLKVQKGMVGKRLSSYCNVCSYVSSFHDGRNGTKERILAFAEETCPKLWAVAQAVAASQQKALVMTSRTCGYLVMLELLRRVAEKSQPPFQVATMDELSTFNHSSNARGQVFRVLVANTSHCSEGVSFLAVRHVYLTEVPTSHGRFIQVCGRAWRMFGHEDLPQEEQTVTYHLFIATLPSWMHTPLASWALRAQPRQRRQSGKMAEIWALELLTRLRKQGINTLEDLQTRWSTFLEGQPEPGAKGLMKFVSEQKLLEDSERFRATSMLRALERLPTEQHPVETWDEVALRCLAQSSRVGMAHLRQNALDSEIFQDLTQYYQTSDHQLRKRPQVPRYRLHSKTSLAAPPDTSAVIASREVSTACRYPMGTGDRGSFGGRKRSRKTG